MDVSFNDDDLNRLATDKNFRGGRPLPIVKADRKRIQTIMSAIDERDFYSLRSLRFEKLKGKRKHQHSMRLNDQMRLVLELIKDNPKGTVIKVIRIEDYH